VWGDPTLSHEIFIDGKRLAITANLHAMLWRLHIDRTTDITIWADAICINQEEICTDTTYASSIPSSWVRADLARYWESRNF